MEETKVTQPQQKSNPRKSIVKKLFKVIGWTIASLLLLIVIALASVVWILSPERLTPIVNDVANKFVNNSQVDVERVELTFWSSFPHLRVDIDSLTVTSHVLDSIDQSIIPDDHSQLLSIGHFHGGVNVMSLISGNEVMGSDAVVSGADGGKISKFVTESLRVTMFTAGRRNSTS